MHSSPSNPNPNFPALNPNKRLSDPVLTELWETKALLNQAANYDPAMLAENARKTVAKLQSQGLLKR